METMQNYTCYCTAEQTRRAYKLGAPLSIAPNDFFTSKNSVQIDSELYSIPTTQQMIGWLRKKGILFEFTDLPDGLCDFSITRKSDDVLICSNEYSITNTQAELAAIDAALDYLEENL